MIDVFLLVQQSVHRCSSASQTGDDDDDDVQRHSILNNDTFQKSSRHDVFGQGAEKSPMPRVMIGGGDEQSRQGTDEGGLPSVSQRV